MKRAGILFLSLAIILVCATVFVIANRPDAPEVIDRVVFNFEASNVYELKIEKAYAYNAFSDTDAQRIEHFINEIKRMEESIKKSKSEKLKTDYSKAINRMKKELRYYDKFKKTEVIRWK